MKNLNLGLDTFTLLSLLSQIQKETHAQPVVRTISSIEDMLELINQLSQDSNAMTAERGQEAPNEKENQEQHFPCDENVVEVVDMYFDRAEKGYKKYGTTTEREDVDLLGWLTHLQEELMDATVYIQRLKKEL